MKQIVDKLNKIAKKIDGSVEIPQTDLIIDSLDAITKAYGGTPNDSNLIVDKLEDIAGVAHNGITPSGNIEITENTAEGEPLDVSQYATATVNVAGGGGINLKTIQLEIYNQTGNEIFFSVYRLNKPVGNNYSIDYREITIQDGQSSFVNIPCEYATEIQRFAINLSTLMDLGTSTFTSILTNTQIEAGTNYIAISNPSNDTAIASLTITHIEYPK